MAPPVLLALCAVLFAVITWQVAADGPLRSLDERVELRIVGHVPGALTDPLADLGEVVVALPVLAAAVAYALWRGRRLAVLYTVLAMVLVPVLVSPLKAVIDRRGPLTEAGGFYPSGHTATAMVAYCGAALLLTPYLKRRWAMPAALVLTLATGIGLVLRGYHWPLDVVGSWCLCGMLLLPFSLRNTRRSSSRTPTG
ncbi:phosphatase PAP2 family protein [Streptomyces sp. NPDC002668]|uniref:phosphatase PAP2 family protein n=1 Tax=Streptomyces sp. NPDC002668 TaxID=3154422 RepID=UPI00331D1E1A